jgi:hypothetical protein
MSETMTRADTLTKSRIAKQTAPNSAEFQFPQFEISKMEVPEACAMPPPNGSTRERRTAKKRLRRPKR